MSSESEKDEQMLSSEDEQSMGSLSGDEQGEGSSESEISDLEENDNEDEEEEDDEEGEDDAESEDMSDGDDNKKNMKDNDDIKKKSSVETKAILKKLKSKYEKLEGKTLFVRLPHRAPQDLVELEKTLKNICKRITAVRRMRQRHARFCLVDFDSPKDRAKGLQQLREAEINGKKLIVAIPKTEDPQFLEKLAEKRIKNLDAKRKRSKLKKIAQKKQGIKEHVQKGKKEKMFTSTIIVQNIPRETALSDFKELFPKAVDVKMNMAKSQDGTSTATVTMETPIIATQVKKSKLKIGENALLMSFAKDKTSTPKKSNKPNAPAQLKGAASSQSPKKGKRKLEKTTTEISTTPKKNKKETNMPGKSGKPQKADKPQKTGKPQKAGNPQKPGKPQQPSKPDRSTKDFKGKKLQKKVGMNNGLNKEPPSGKPQNQNTKNDKDKKQNYQKNPSAIKNSPNKIQGKLGLGAGEGFKKHIKNKDKNTQNPKWEAPLGAAKKSLAKGNKAGKSFKNKKLKAN